MKTSNQQIEVDINNTTEVKCQVENCDGTLFARAEKLRRMSPLVSPTGETAVIPMAAFYCISCKTEIDIDKLQA